MNTCKVIAFGLADGRGVVGSSGIDVDWEEHGVRPLGTGGLYRQLFGRQDDTYRRLDRQSKCVVLAVAATGIDRLLSPEAREGCAIVTETLCGSIEVDLHYMKVLRMGMAHGAVFPYTLQSTCLGDVSLRHGLQGPTISLSVTRDERGVALREALRLIAGGEAKHLVVGRVNALTEPVGDPVGELQPQLGAVYAVLAARTAEEPEVLEWPEDGDVLRAIEALCRPACGQEQS